MGTENVIFTIAVLRQNKNQQKRLYNTKIFRFLGFIYDLLTDIEINLLKNSLRKLKTVGERDFSP